MIIVSYNAALYQLKSLVHSVQHCPFWLVEKMCAIPFRPGLSPNGNGSFKINYSLKCLPWIILPIIVTCIKVWFYSSMKFLKFIFVEQSKFLTSCLAIFPAFSGSHASLYLDFFSASFRCVYGFCRWWVAEALWMDCWDHRNYCWVFVD